jgi:hypothetical protein
MSQFENLSRVWGESASNQVTVVTIGYDTFTAPSNVISELVLAAAHGQIRQVNKHYNSNTNEYEAIVKAPVTVTGEFLKQKANNQAEIEKLEARLKELKGE